MATREEARASRGDVGGRQVLIAVGALVLLLIVLWFLFLRGGGEEPVAAPITPPVTVDPTPEVTPDAEPNQPKDGPVETFEVFASKDPFEPLVNPAGTTGAPTGTAPATGGTGDTGGASAGDGNGGNGSGTGDGSGTGGGNGGGGSGGSNVDGHTVRLIDTFRQNGRMRAQIQVDGTVYTVDVGERFADNFELVDVSGECASILYGDDQFSICEGEEILK